jgi:hypothetical protein
VVTVKTYEEVVSLDTLPQQQPQRQLEEQRRLREYAAQCSSWEVVRGSRVRNGEHRSREAPAGHAAAGSRQPAAASVLHNTVCSRTVCRQWQCFFVLSNMCLAACCLPTDMCHKLSATQWIT